jgi:hypothetical protein
MHEEERERYLRLVQTPLGERRGGLVRYAAAMQLYQHHLIGADTLEIFRICAPDDHLEPVSELERLGLTKDLDLFRRR